jgi:cold-inducible RNA-binding protein
MGRRLYIENLPLTASVASLTELFASSGAVSGIEIVMNQRTGRPQGHAFVEMGTDAEAQKAIGELNGKDWQGNRLTVTHAGPTPRKPGFSGSSTTEERKNR